MPDEKPKTNYNERPFQYDKIRVATSKPSLKNKIQTNLNGSTENIYWYIRFNIPLNAESVSEKTMDVTDTDGYIMRTDIQYNEKKHFIVISPLDSYEQNRFYLLNISKKVRSARGQNLRSPIHILFKLLDNEISNYTVLRKDEKIPKPKARPADYDQRQAARKINQFDSYADRSPREQLVPMSFKINMLLGLPGLPLVAAGLYLKMTPLIILGALFCLGGLAHIYIQFQNRELASAVTFNRGVRLFNKRRYRAAETLFQKSLTANPANEMAKYGLYKAGLHLEN